MGELDSQSIGGEQASLLPPEVVDEPLHLPENTDTGSIDVIADVAALPHADVIRLPERPRTQYPILPRHASRPMVAALHQTTTVPVAQLMPRTRFRFGPVEAALFTIALIACLSVVGMLFVAGWVLR